MGLAEDNYAILTQWLGQGRRPTQGEYNRSKPHAVPPNWEAGQSQNWWVLGCGVRFAYGDHSELGDITWRLDQERDVIGTWGSEQHSPIYRMFHIVGRLSIIKAIDNPDDLFTKLAIK